MQESSETLAMHRHSDTHTGEMACVRRQGSDVDMSRALVL